MQANLYSKMFMRLQLQLHDNQEIADLSLASDKQCQTKGLHFLCLTGTVIRVII